jgi:mannose-binding lectin 2
MVAEGGYYMREHSLVAPYQGTGMDIPFWEFGGTSVVTSSYVRLTPDRQSKQGNLWNTAPLQVHNWDVLLHFNVHGKGKDLFGDGFAFWYTKEKGQFGPIFGNAEYFTGLGIFFDTYSNYNGEHSHEHPYISAMINNGTLHYDHDRDGTHSQIAGCSVKFRNAQHDTFVAVSYINRRITVLTNIHGDSDWDHCFVVPDVDLPTGYFLGVSAATGDLADNHVVISVKTYDMGGSPRRGTVAEEFDWSTVIPQAKDVEAPRPHVDDVPPWFGPNAYRAISVGLLILLAVGILAIVGGVAFVQAQSKRKKHFF